MGALVAFIYIVGTWVVVLTYREYPDRSSSARLYWALVYLMGVVAPVAWGLVHGRLLRQMGLTDPRLRRYLFAPIVSGGLTLLFALRLIARH